MDVKRAVRDLQFIPGKQVESGLTEPDGGAVLYQARSTS